MAEPIPDAFEIVAEVQFKAAEDKRGRPYILITVNAGNVTVFRTSTDRERAIAYSRDALKGITDETRELFFRCTNDAEDVQTWDVIARKENAA